MDVFAAGCVLAELYIGRGLFPYTGNDIERLAILERVLGFFPAALAKQAERIRPKTFTLGTPVRVQYQPSPKTVDSSLASRVTM